MIFVVTMIAIVLGVCAVLGSLIVENRKRCAAFNKRLPESKDCR